MWFGGKLVQKLDGGSVSYASEDRLGSVGKYLPYGESRSGSTPPADNEKFATYTRDAGTGLDYADQRWHVAGSGRFLTSDPYQASGGPADPGSWNRFGYVLGDPVGLLDPNGLDLISVADMAARLFLYVSSTPSPSSTSVTVYGGSGGGWFNLPGQASLELELWLNPWDSLTWGYTTADGGGESSLGGKKPKLPAGVTRDRCHDRNIGLMAATGINVPADATMLANGGVLWLLPAVQAAALGQSLVEQGYTSSTVTGRMHNGETGSPNTDLRSYSQPFQRGSRSIQVVLGPVGFFGPVWQQSTLIVIRRIRI